MVGHLVDPAADLAQLPRPVRWPVPTEAEALADGALAFGLGLLAALAVYGLLRLFLARRAAPGAAMLAELAASRGLAPAERLLAQARIAGRLRCAAEIRGRLKAALYLPESGIDLAETDAALDAAIRAAPSRRAA